jgi:hypothetical protein
MTDHAHASTATNNVYDAAKAIANVLRRLDKTKQSLAMRFVSEELGLPATLHVAAPPSTSHEPHSILPSSPAPTAQHSTNFEAFYRQKKPESDLQFAAIVAYFYRFEVPEAQRLDSIDADVLMKEARAIKDRKRPASPQQTLVNAKNAGYLEAVGNGNYKLTAVGENLVAVTLGEGEAVKKPGKHKPKRGNRPRVKKVTKVKG